MHDDPYHACTFAWGQSQTPTAPKLKELLRQKLRLILHNDIVFCLVVMVYECACEGGDCEGGDSVRVVTV